MSREQAILRHQFADYLNCGTAENPDWQLMGYGFTAINETFGASTESTKYVNDKAESTDVVSYSSQFPFTAHMIKSEAAIQALYNVGRNHVTGDGTIFEYVRVELWDETETANTFKARKFEVSAEVSEISGDNKQELSGNLNGRGDPINGTFNTTTKAFTAT